MKLFVLLLFFKGAEMVGGFLAGVATDDQSCHDVAVGYITSHKADIVKLAGEQGIIAVHCMPIPEMQTETPKPEVQS